ncbi:MAG: C25 family cysteine peptidase [Promethearchaeota archaeon]
MKRLSLKYYSIFFISIIIIPYFNLGIAHFERIFYNSGSQKIEINTEQPEIDLSLLPKINYSQLLKQYYDPNIEMIIITPENPDFVNTVKPLSDWKNKKGVRTVILSNYSQYEGSDGPEKIRNMIKSYYEKYNIRWVLLAGDAQDNILPIRKVYNPDVLRWGEGQTESVDGEYYKPTDYYYADLTGDWDNDKDGKYGEAPQDNSNGVDEIDWYPEVYVGRLPADSKSELETMVNKSLKYEKDPQIGSWMGRMLLAGAISDSTNDEAILTKYIINHFVIGNINYTFLEQSGSKNLTEDNFRSEFNSGNSLIFFAGHGAPTKYQGNNFLTVYTSTDANSCSNNNMPSLIYADACTTSPYDDESYSSDASIGEILINKENAGAIGVIGALRVTWYFPDDNNLEKLNRGNAKLFWKEFFENKKYQPGRALYDSKVAYIESDYYKRGEGSLEYDFERKNLLTYCLLGDPEIDIYTGIPKNASNPFPSKIYEAQKLEITVKNDKGEIVPYARVHLTSKDGKYFTTYADINGIARFRLAPQGNETYNITITGHNLIPTYFNFTTLPDNTFPELLSLDWTPKDMTVSNNLCFDAIVNDTYSGIENVFVLISDNDFKSYTYYQFTNNTSKNDFNFECSIKKLDPGTYKFAIVVRDYANNTKLIYDNNFIINVPVPLTNYLLSYSLIGLMILAIVSCSAVVYGNKKLKKQSEREKDLELLIKETF